MTRQRGKLEISCEKNRGERGGDPRRRPPIQNKQEKKEKEQND